MVELEAHWVGAGVLKTQLLVGLGASLAFVFSLVDK